MINHPFLRQELIPHKSEYEKDYCELRYMMLISETLCHCEQHLPNGERTLS